jgi:hypothetical protein
MWIHDDRDLRVDLAFLVIFAGLLAYSLLAWQHLLGLGPLWHPRQLIWLNVALFCQANARLLRRPSRRLFYGLSAFSLVALTISLAPR